MEPKKTAKADLDKQRPLFFSIGLLIAMSLAVLGFQYRQYDNTDIELDQRKNIQVEELIDVPPTKMPPPPQPILQQPNIVEVPDEKELKEDLKIEFDMEITEATKVQEITISEPVADQKEDVDEIFLIVEQTAEPKGGMQAFYKYVNEGIKYPAQARRQGVEGRVFVEFVVDREGNLTDVHSVKGIGAGCDEEAIRIIQSSPKWIPAKQRGKAVRQRMVLPITFKLAER
ncbi:MAG: energy transducer TonB [Cyclobacteriaceae bacterium]|nr:energy transducer TonB [Cyclobacteriaceae bacterium]